jgi:hypothetical protein
LASLTAQPGRRLQTALPAFAFALLVVAVYANPLLTRRNFAGLDLLPYNLPLEKSIHDAYSRGRLPVWTPEISGGRPLMPNPNAGALYPLRPILAQLPFPVAMRVYPIVHWIAAGLGMILLLNSLGASRVASWIGAVTYAFSGVAVAEVFYPHILPGMALLPWVVWAMHRHNGSEGIKLLILSLLFGLLFLAGDVFTIGVAIAACVLWIAVERPGSGRTRDLLVLLVALLLAGLVAAPQIVASALWVPQTNRAILGMKLGDSFYLSVSPFRLLEFVVPFPFGPAWSLDPREIWGSSVFRGRAMGLFTTLYCGALAVIGLAAKWTWRPPGVRFARVLFLVALAVSVPPSLLPSSWANVPSPLPLRNPEKFAVAAAFALAILAGLSLDRFRASARLPRWTLVVAALLAVLGGAAALFPERAGRAAVGAVRASGQFTPIAARQLPPALAESGLLWIATVVALDLHRKRGRAPLAVSLVLLTAVPLAANRKIARTLREEDVFSASPFARFLHRADPAGRYRTIGESFYQTPTEIEAAQPVPPADYSWVFHRHAVWRRGTVLNFDFDAGDLARVESLWRVSLVAARFRDSQPFFGNLALRWGIRFRDQNPLPGYRRFRTSGLQYWDELPEALPDIRLVESWREETDPLAAASLLPRLKLGDVVLETGSRGAGRSRPGMVRVLADEPERLSLETESPDPSWIFVLRGFWNYRTVLLDGRPAECIPAQLAFSAVAVPSGRHRIEWREEVPGGSVSRWGPAVFALLMAALLIRERRTARRG